MVMPDKRQRVNRDVASPMYEQIAQIIMDRIDSGALAVGARLPSELEMAESYSVSRDTIRQALGVLERNGLVRRRRAKGTFVAKNRVAQNLGELRSFHGGLLKQGLKPEMELLEFRPLKTPSSLSDLFKTNEVMKLVRRYTVTGNPLAVVEIYLHPQAREIPWDVAEKHDTYTLLERFLERPIARASAKIRAETAGRAIGGLLDLRVSAPVLSIFQDFFAASGEILAHSSLKVRADDYEFHIDLPHQRLAIFEG